MSPLCRSLRALYSVRPPRATTAWAAWDALLPVVMGRGTPDVRDPHVRADLLEVLREAHGTERVWVAPGELLGVAAWFVHRPDRALSAGRTEGEALEVAVIAAAAAQMKHESREIT